MPHLPPQQIAAFLFAKKHQKNPDVLYLAQHREQSLNYYSEARGECIYTRLEAELVYPTRLLTVVLKLPYYILGTGISS
jgi:hypothetical protein